MTSQKSIAEPTPDISDESVPARGSQQYPPAYLKEFYSRWIKWTGIQDDDILEAIDYLCGDMFFEMRKLTSKLCTSNETSQATLIKRLIADLQIPKEDKEKARIVGRAVIESLEEEKSRVREHVNRSWKEIIDKQKVGVDKVAIVVTRLVLDKKKKEYEATRK